MADLMQQAREFLAVAHENAGDPLSAEAVRKGWNPVPTVELEAIAAALRAAPEGFVLVPVELPAAEVRAVIWGEGLAAIDECDAENPNADRYERLGWLALVWPELLAELAARPQGVK